MVLGRIVKVSSGSKSTYSRIKRKGASKRMSTRGYRAVYKSKPASRQVVSRRKYYRNKVLSNHINNIAESKLLALAAQNERNPIPIQTGAQATFIAFNLGATAAFTGSVPLNGIQIAQGTGFNERNGNYVYFKKTHLVSRIEMNAAENAPPVQFRMIVAKLRRQNSPEGITASWQSSGFLDSSGLPFGHVTSGKTGLDLMMQPLNKRQWVIYCDKKFILQPYNDFPPQAGQTNIIYNHYPSQKELQFNLPYYKKTYINASNEPEDLAYRYIVIVYGHTLGRSGIVATSYEQNIRGTTSFADI